jgi:hypothetical protein
MVKGMAMHQLPYYCFKCNDASQLFIAMQETRMVQDNEEWRATVAVRRRQVHCCMRKSCMKLSSATSRHDELKPNQTPRRDTNGG